MQPRPLRLMKNKSYGRDVTPPLQKRFCTRNETNNVEITTNQLTQTNNKVSLDAGLACCASCGKPIGQCIHTDTEHLNNGY